ncbi:staphylopine family metallophore export MFS transporter CntE [Paenibacillus xanthanilyticus]|uniref:Staphylopine family metallophore export MFS transporter CntE n=1 Tax=Paenibacillus xanthanilyticus TaxID=1783531 RepID=A0ABV8JUX3_9BACL
MGGALSWPFVRLYVLALLFFSANAILNVIIPLRGDELGASNAAIGVIMGAYMFTAMVMRPWAGHIIQKHGPLKVLRLILLLNGCALILYTFTGLGGYLVARMMQGVSTAFFSMALQIGIIDALPEKERSQGISLYSLFTYMPGIVGPIIALNVWQAGGMGDFTWMLIGIAVFTGLFGFSAARGDDKSRPGAGANGPHSRASQSWGQLVRNPILLTCSLLMCGASVVFGAVTTFMPLYAAELPGVSAGIYLMIQAGTVVLGRFALRRRIPSDGKWHSAFMMGTMLLLTAAALCVSLAATVSAMLLYVGALLMGIAQALLYPTLTTYLSFVLPPASRNVLIGLFIATADLGVSLGGVLMGPIADATSYSGMYAICAGLGAVQVIIAYGKRQHRMDERLELEGAGRQAGS